ncbi:polysaccharide deacetylase family protein [bacterium]|nr:polysaccharide deacetylase family protein [bacterium]
MKKKIFIIASIILILVSVFFIYKKVKSPYITVLMYHQIINKNDIPKKYLDEYGNVVNPFVILTEKFEHQMDILKENNFYTLTLDDVLLFVEGKKEFPKNSILITFDDGNKNNYINAYPILKKRNMNAVIFLITSKISENNDEYNPKKSQYLSKTEIIKSKDVFEFASHTNNMHKREKDTNQPYLKSKSEEEVKKDIQESLKNVDKPYFAYPYGSYNKKVSKILAKSGIKAAFSTHRGKIRKGDNLYELKRNIVEEKYSDEKFKKIIGIK